MSITLLNWQGHSAKYSRFRLLNLITEIIILWSNIKEHLINQWIFLEFYSGFSSVDTILSFEEFRVYDLMRWIATVTRRISADNLPYEKVGKNEPVCIANEVPFEIPESWEWARLKDLAIKEIKRGKSPKYADDSNVYVFAQKCNVKLGGIDISLAKFLDIKTFDKYPVEEYMTDGDIIINSTGNGTLGRIGIFRDSDRINDFVIVPDSHVTIIRAGNQMIKDYLFFALKYHQPYLEKLGEGSTNQTELRSSTVAELFIPVTPIGEQERIVAKLLEVLPMADVYGIKEKALQDYNKSSIPKSPSNLPLMV